MPRHTKIATCCYCGTRAALVLQGRESRELACSSCGAPLHALKSLRADAVDPDAHRSPRKGRRKSAPDKPAMRTAVWERALAKPKKRKRKSPMRRLFGEFVDLVEDILD